MNITTASAGQVTTASTAKIRSQPLIHCASSRSTPIVSPTNSSRPSSCCERGSSPKTEKKIEFSVSISGGCTPVPTRSAISPFRPVRWKTIDSRSEIIASRSGASPMNCAS